ncbi:hypothetical protein AAEX28_01675 [Lentisphaerota bacterium WC36G]|nr:hypothetical protein LJT99_04560 [Lentisphaerae bacterium WC36]
MPPLATFLQEQAFKGKSEYILPEQPEMYKKNVSGISHRVKKFLESVNIITSKVPKGRTRAVNVKDVHSLRHLFCYYAGMQQRSSSSSASRSRSYVSRNDKTLFNSRKRMHLKNMNV